MSSVQPIIGHLLSKHNSSALEGVEKIIALTYPPDAGSSRSFADAFISEQEALKALVSFLDRSCDTTLVYKAFISLIDTASPGNKISICRFLCQQTFFGSFRKNLNVLREDNVTAICGCLSLSTKLLRLYPKLIMARLHREIPLSLGIFKTLTFRTFPIRPFRCLFLAQFALTSFAVVNAATVSTHGYLTQLISDASELVIAKEYSADDPIVMEAINASLQVIKDSFVTSAQLSSMKKREVLMGQRNILRHCIKWMGVTGAFESSAGVMFETMRSLVTELAEEPSDYAVSRTSAIHEETSPSSVNSSYMPNFALFSLLRLLHPHNSVAEARLAVFILTKSPDLLRPFNTRVSLHIFENSGTATKTLHYAAVTNVMCRICSGPLPYHIADPTVASLQLEGVTIGERGTTPTTAAITKSDSQGTMMFYTLTPRNVAEEICPPHLGEFIHRIINKSDNLLHLLMATQMTQAALNRAAAVMERVQAMFVNRSSNVISSVVDNAVTRNMTLEYSLIARDTFMTHVEAVLKEFLPRIEEFWHRVTQQLLPIAVEPKAQYLLQRLYIVARCYSDVLHMRNPWISAVPTPRRIEGSVNHAMRCITLSAIMKEVIIPMLSWEGKTVACLCTLLLHNLTRGVTLTKLHHITLGSNVSNEKGKNSSSSELDVVVNEWPPLLSFLLWYIYHRNDKSESAMEGKGYIVRLVLWCLHNVSLRFSVIPREVYLWMNLLSHNTAPLFLHMLNSMLQQSLSKAADRVSDALSTASHGVLHESAMRFISRTRDKLMKNAIDGTKPTVGKQSVWQADLISNLDEFEALTNDVVRLWHTSEETFATEIDTPLHILVSKQAKGVQSLQMTVLGAAEASTVGVPLSARVIQLLLAASAMSRIGGSTGVIIEKQINASLQFLSSQVEHLEGPLLEATRLTCNTKIVLPNLTTLLSDNLSYWIILARSPAAYFIAAMVTTETQRKEVTPASKLFVSAYLNALSVWVNQTSDAEVEAVLASFKGQQERTGLGMLLSVTATVVYHAARLSGEELLSSQNTDTLSDFIASKLYTGTLSLMDRAFYSSMLLLELSQKMLINRNSSSSNIELLEENIEDNDNKKDAIEDDEDDNSSIGNSDEKTDIEKNKVMNASSRVKEVYFSAATLVAIRRVRYAVGNISPCTTAIPEVDVLSQLLDGWSDAEILNAAVLMPRNLHNNIHSISLYHAPNVLRCFYPDVGSVGEYTLQGRLSGSHPSVVVDDAMTDDSRLMDPRYIIPLLRTIAALRIVHPEHVPPHLLARSVPFMIMALSCTDSSLRTDGGIAMTLAAKTLGGVVRSMVQYIRIRVASRDGTTDSNEKILRLSTPFACFLCSSLFPLQHIDHPLHMHITNCFVTPKGHRLKPDASIHPAPLSHLLTEFPLSCVTNEQMLARQEESYRMGVAADSGTTAEAAAKVTKVLRSNSAPHLQHILQQLRFSVTTKEDLDSLVEAHVPSNLFLLASTLQATPVLRLQVIRVICSIVLTSKDVAEAAMLHPDIRILQWSLLFANNLLQEISLLQGGRPRDDALRIEALDMILDTLYRIVYVTRSKIPSATASSYRGMVVQLRDHNGGGKRAQELLTQLCEML